MQFSAQRNGTMAYGGTKTVNQTFDSFNVIKQNYPNQIEQYPDLKRKLESYPNMDPASLFAVVSLMSGLGPERLTEMSSAALSDNLSTYGRFSYRATGDKRFLDLTKVQQRRNLGPTVSDTQVSQAIGAKPGDLMAALPNENIEDTLLRIIGVNEGTRTADGGYTSAHGGHSDPGDHNTNIGSVSASSARGTAVSNDPMAVDKDWKRRIRGLVTKHAPALQAAGLKPGSNEYKAIQLAVVDLTVQAPGAVNDFIKKIPQILQKGVTRESIAEARAQSYINPSTGRLEASGFQNNYDRLYADQLRRSRLFK